MGNQAKFPTSNTPGKQRARGFQKVPDTTPRDLDAYNQYMLDRQRRMDYDASMEARQQRMDAQARQDVNQSYKDVLGRAPNSTEQSQYETLRKASGDAYNLEDLRNSLKSGSEAQNRANTATLDAYYKQKYGDQSTSPKGITMGAGYSNRPFG